MSALFESRRSESWPTLSQGAQFGNNERGKFGVEKKTGEVTADGGREKELMLRGSVSGPTETGNMAVSSVISYMEEITTGDLWYCTILYK